MEEEAGMSLYPAAEQVPWKHLSPAGLPTYYSGQCVPEAVVLHVMAGWASTSRQWAMEGHYGASWHYTIGLDGKVMQHLLHKHGGYHAGIPPSAPRPTWPLWRGYGTNVNSYTIGIEMEGFPWGQTHFSDGSPIPVYARIRQPAQLLALRDLCKWLAADLGIPYDRAHFPAHAEIDLVNRPNDFDTPGRREAVYAYLFKEDEMTKDEIEKLVNERIDAALAHQFPPLLAASVTGGFTADEAQPFINTFLANLPRVDQGVDYEKLGAAILKLGQAVQLMGRGV